VLAACGTAVTVNPGFSPRAAGKIDRMLLVIDNQSGLRGIVGGERPVEAIAREVQKGSRALAIRSGRPPSSVSAGRRSQRSPRGAPRDPPNRIIRTCSR
jgi:hypothetical protein